MTAGRAVVTIVLLLCALSVVSAQYATLLYQRQGDGSCAQFAFGSCHSCTDNCGRTRYYMCTSDGDDVDCISSQYSNCENHDSHPSVYHAECGQLGACELGFQQKFTVEWAVDATSTLAAYSEPHGRDSYVQMSGQTAVTQGHVANILYVSGGDQVRFETAFNDTTYLTSAGTCAFGQTCYAGDLAYRASVLPLANVTEPELKGTRVEIHTDGLVGFKNADPTTTSSFTALLGSELNLGSDELSEVVLEATVRGETVVLSNLVLGRINGDAPVLYFDVDTESGLSEYDYVTCEWEGRYESSEEWYYFISPTSFWWYDDAVSVDRMERAASTNSTSISVSATPSPSRSLTPSSTLSNTRTRSSPASTSQSMTPSYSVSSSRTVSHQCSPLYIEPSVGGNNEEYVRCSLDRLFDSDEFFSYGGFGSFDSFALVRTRPLDKLLSALQDFASIFRL